MQPSRLFVIHIGGPSTAGKSSVFKVLTEKIDQDVYTVSYDKLKWGLNNYHRDKHKAVIKELVLGLYGSVCAKRLPILLDNFLENESEYANYKRIAEDNRYTFLSIELTAPIEVLLERFRERVRSATLAGSKIAVTDESIFLTQTSKRPFFHENTPVFDTSIHSAESIAETIIEMIESSSQ